MRINGLTFVTVRCLLIPVQCVCKLVFDLKNTFMMISEERDGFFLNLGNLLHPDSGSLLPGCLMTADPQLLQLVEAVH